MKILIGDQRSRPESTWCINCLVGGDHRSEVSPVAERNSLSEGLGEESGEALFARQLLNHERLSLAKEGSVTDLAEKLSKVLTSSGDVRVSPCPFECQAGVVYEEAGYDDDT
jgi:hypothetical protein